MPKKKTIRKRANKSGTIVKLKGNRRKPFAVRVTTGRDQETGKLIRKDLEYFETEIEASDFLDMYNLMKKKNNRITISDEQAKMIDNDLFEKVKSVTNQEKQMLTFGEIFWLLYEDKYKQQKSHTNKISWFRNFVKLHNVLINSISLFDLQMIFDDLKSNGRGDGTLAHMKVIASNIFEYAVIHQYIKRDQDFTSYIDVSVDKNAYISNKRKHAPFSISEIKQLIADNSISAKMILIYIFTGCRPIELFSISTDKIYINIECEDNGEKQIVSYMITGSKTEAGINRIVPIHKLIEPYIIELLNMHSGYLLLNSNEIVNLNYHYKKYFFDKLMLCLNMNHSPYDTRHTFSTLAKLNKVETFAIKRIMGHKSNDLTDDVYTHSIINYLYEQVNKIKV